MALILLAEDEAATRDLVKRALEAEGHSVVLAKDGGEAIAALDGPNGGIEVLIADVEMPVIDGIALAERALERAPGVRILLMSGFPEQLGRASTLKAAHLLAIAKPFTLEQIRKEVRTLLA